MVTEILIKSFNRPFYLDRCIYSIKQYVTGNIKIKVLDDGTPKKYLDKIRNKYPDVDIFLSENYEKKINAIQENLKTGNPINGMEIPTKFWYDCVNNSSDYFIMTEEDVWLTRSINIDNLHQQAQKFGINLMKLGWLGNDSDNKHLNFTSISNELESSNPKDLILLNRRLMNAFFYNQYKFFTILYKLKLVDNFSQRKYWALNSILMGFYKKEYWMEIWQGMDGKVDEKKQLINASLFYKRHKNNPNFISRLKTEAMKTTFQSSATNSYHEYGFDYDVNLFNHMINEAWLKGDFDAMQNFPKDFSLNYFKNFTSEKINFSEYEKWVQKFRGQYEAMGCKTD